VTHTGPPNSTGNLNFEILKSKMADGCYLKKSKNGYISATVDPLSHTLTIRTV